MDLPRALNIVGLALNFIGSILLVLISFDLELLQKIWGRAVKYPKEGRLVYLDHDVTLDALLFLSIGFLLQLIALIIDP